MATTKADMASDRVQATAYKMPADLPEAHGVPLAREGMIRPYWARPGLGLEFKRQDAQRYVV
jgi:hypothetical protein